MTDRDLKKMNRKELLELLITLTEENNQLKDQLEKQNLQLESRDIEFKKAGSLAEAALKLNRIFEDADKAAEQYLLNIKRCSEQPEKEYDRMISKAEAEAKEILRKAEEEKQKKIEEADAYWNDLTVKLEAFCKEHPGLRELVKDRMHKESEDK